MALKYRVVKRVYKGNELDHYTSICSNGQQRDLDKEQLAYLAAKGQIENLQVVLTKTDVAFRGVGININDLPVERLKSDAVTEREEAAAKKDYVVTLIGALMEGRTLIGYYARTADGKKGTFQKEKIIEMADNGLVTNAVAVMRNGTKGIKGKAGFKLQTLKIYQRGDKLD